MWACVTGRDHTRQAQATPLDSSLLYITTGKQQFPCVVGVGDTTTTNEKLPTGKLTGLVCGFSRTPFTEFLVFSESQPGSATLWI